MPKYGLTHNNLMHFALRGEESIIPGRKLLLVHTGRAYTRPFSNQVTAVTGIIELTDTELARIQGSTRVGGNEKKKVFLIRKSNGELDYRHATDAGILPYNMGQEFEEWNRWNYTVDLKALKKLGIKVQR